MKRIALLNPSGWGNLGDAAIIDATKHGLSAAAGEPCSFLLITLNPFDSATRHGAPAIELSWQSKRKYPIAERPTAAWWTPVMPGQSQPARAATAFSWLPSRVQQRLAPIIAVGKEALHFLVCLRYMARTDLLVIAGGGQLDDYWGGARGHPWSLWKWTLAAKLSRARVVFASVGVGSIRSRSSAYLMRRALARAAYVSVRDPKSQSLVASRLGTADVKVVPDLALSLSQAAELANRTRKRGESARPIVLVSPIGWKQPRLWPEPDVAAYRTYLQGLAEAIVQFLDQGAAVRIVRSDSADVDSVNDLVAAVTAKTSADQRTRFASSATDAVEQFLAELSNADMLIASRLHSVILAHAAGVPVVALSYDMKVDEQMKAAGSADDTLSIESFAPGELVARVQHRLSAGDTPQRYARVHPTWFEALSAQFVALIGYGRSG